MKKNVSHFNIIKLASIIFLSSISISYSQSKIIMKVNNDILDCPHFSMLLNQIVENKFQGKIIEKNTREKYIIFSVSNNNDLDNNTYIEIFRNKLDSIKFPAASIKEIVITK